MTIKKFLIFVTSVFVIGIFCANSWAATEYYEDGDVSDTAYDATSWDGKTTEAASKNAIRDKIEAMGSGATAWDDITNPDANDTINMVDYIIQLQLGSSGDFRIGDGGSNYTKFGTNGTITFHGSAEINEVPLDSDFSSNGRMERKGAGDYVIASTDYVNASWYGSGYAAIQTAIDTGAARVYIPSGTWSVTGNGTTADGIRLRSNLELFGDGANETIISQAASSQFAIAVGTSSSEGGPTPSTDNYKNIYIHDLQVLGDVVTSGFSEHYHAMTISGVSDVLIERVYFEGFRGDGLFLGSTHTGAIERHNERVTIRDCVFDGINKDNRNAITIIDCDGALIESSYFTRTTKSTMPGAIDIEPNVDNFAIVRNIIITDNKFYDIGGATAVIAYSLPVNQATLTTPSRHIVIKNNYIDTCSKRGIYLKQTGTVSNSTTPNDILVEGNSISSGEYGFTMVGVKDVRFENNSFQETTNWNAIGDDVTTGACRDVFFTNNTFLHCGTSRGTGVAMYYSDVVTFDRNIFDDCGNSTTHGYGIFFGAAGASSYVKLLNNTFIAPTGITTVAVKKHASHTFTSATNQYRGNDLHDLSSEFVSTNLWTDAEISDDLTLAKLQLDHNVETLAANKTLIITDKVIQKLDPDGTDRNVLLPVENTATDLTFFIYNMGGEVGEDLNVQDDAAVDILSIGYLQLGFCTCDGTTWTVRCFSCAEAVCCINLRAKEENTSAIVIGQPVYISGATGVALPNAGLADCDDSSKIRVKGLAAEDISQNSTGYIRVKGLLEDVNSTKGSSVNSLSQDWTAGDQLWVSTTVGSLTNVRPIGRSVKIGTALTVEGVSSKILVDVRENSIYTGAASGEDIVRQMGDSAGANKIIYQDFGGNEVASLDSDGNAIYNTVTTDSIAVGAVASPRLRALDSDSPGTDKFAGSIDWQYVDGADGAENTDIYLRSQQGGANTTQAWYDESYNGWMIPTGKHLYFGTVRWDLEGTDYMAAASMEDGTVSGTEFKYINSLSSNAQDQIDGKQATVTEGSLANNVILTADIKDDEILEADLDVTNAPTDNYLLSFDLATGGFTWVVTAGGGDLMADGSVPLTANWDVGAFTITGLRFVSDQATGTAPLTVASTTVVTNLNADTVDGESASTIVTAARVGGVSANLDDADASVEWEDAEDLDASGGVTGAITPTTITSTGDIKQQFDAAAFLTISTADGGASTISQTSDGQDQIIIGDGSDSTVIKVAVGADAMADDNYSGIVLSGWNCGEAITQWDTVYLDDTSNEWMQADADAAGEFPARGVAVAACTNGNPGIILVQGTIRNDGWTWTGNGKTLYLSDTVAGMAEAAPSTANDCVQVVGFTLDDDTIYVNFSGHWLLVE